MAQEATLTNQITHIYQNQPMTNDIVSLALKRPVTHTTGTERSLAARATAWLPLRAISPPLATTACVERITCMPEGRRTRGKEMLRG